MSGISGKIESETNLAELAKLLQELPANFVAQDVKKAMRVSWTKIYNAARELVPVDTGRTRELISIRVGYSKKRQEIFAIVGIKRITKKQRYAIREKKVQRKISQTTLEYDAYYSIFVEFGTEHQKAQPFMRPAFDQHFREAFSEFGGQVKLGYENRLKKLSKATKRRIS